VLLAAWRLPNLFRHGVTHVGPTLALEPRRERDRGLSSPRLASRLDHGLRPYHDLPMLVEVVAVLPEVRPPVRGEHRADGTVPVETLRHQPTVDLFDFEYPAPPG